MSPSVKILRIKENKVPIHAAGFGISYLSDIIPTHSLKLRPPDISGSVYQVTSRDLFFLKIVISFATIVAG